ncbi:hypothetical protein LLG10_01325 [bacterium]|nr:hypothetical protein [bacterium]
MKKCYYILIISFLFTLIIGGYSCKKDTTIYEQNIELNPFDPQTVLVTKYRNKVFDITRSNLLLDMTNKSIQPIASQFNGCIDFSLTNYDTLDFNDIVANFKPSGKEFYEIGRFDEPSIRYSTLFADPEADTKFIFYSKIHNLVFFQKDSKESSNQEIIVMDRDGNKVKSITNGFKVHVYKCLQLDDFRYLFSCFNERTQKDCLLIYHYQTDKLYIMSDKKQSYNLLEIYNNMLLTEIKNNDNSDIEVCIFNYEFVLQKSICKISDVNSNNNGEWLIDKEDNYLFFSYVSNRNECKILEININENSENVLFLKKIEFSSKEDQNRYHPPLSLYFDKERNSLIFITDKWDFFSEQTTLHFLDLTSKTTRVFLLPDKANYFFSSDGSYVLCLGVGTGNDEWSNNGIFDTYNNEFIDLQKKIDLDLNSQCVFSEHTKQFFISPHYTDYYPTLFVNVDGSLEEITMGF